MSSSVEEKACFLCGGLARSQRADAGKVERFLCSSEACGDYDISDTAKAHLVKPPELKAKILAEAKWVRASEPQKVLEIKISTTLELPFRVRERLPFPY
jgi:hypothetical protein